MSNDSMSCTWQVMQSILANKDDWSSALCFYLCLCICVCCACVWSIDLIWFVWFDWFDLIWFDLFDLIDLIWFSLFFVVLVVVVACQWAVWPRDMLSHFKIVTKCITSPQKIATALGVTRDPMLKRLILPTKNLWHVQLHRPLLFRIILASYMHPREDEELEAENDGILGRWFIFALPGGARVFSGEPAVPSWGRCSFHFLFTSFLFVLFWWWGGLPLS